MNETLELERSKAYKNFAIAVIENALKAATAGDRSARDWLYFTGYEWTCLVTGQELSHANYILGINAQIGQKAADGINTP